MFPVDLVDADPAAGQQAGEPAGSGAPHRVDQHVEVRRLDSIEVDGPPHELLVAVERIEPLDEPGRLTVGQRTALHALEAIHREACLDGRQDIRPGRGAGRRLDLESVVDPRVVAGGDDDAGRGTAFDDLVRAHLGRDGVDGEDHGDVVAEQDLGGSLGEVFRGEAPVEGDDHALGRCAGIGHEPGDPVRAAPDVLERVFVGDARPPAVRAEHDGRGRAGSGGGRHSASCLGTAFDELADAIGVRRRSAQHRDRLGGGHAAALRRGDDAEPALDATDHEVAIVGGGNSAGQAAPPFLEAGHALRGDIEAHFDAMRDRLDLDVIDLRRLVDDVFGQREAARLGC